MDEAQTVLSNTMRMLQAVIDAPPPDNRHVRETVLQFIRMAGSCVRLDMPELAAAYVDDLERLLPRLGTGL